MFQMALPWYYMLAFVSLGISSFSQILLKKAAMKKYDHFIKEYLNVYVIGAYMMFAISLLLTTICYGGLPFKLVPLLESLGYVIVMVLAYAFFGEKITKRKLLGTACILAGIAVFHM